MHTRFSVGLVASGVFTLTVLAVIASPTPAAGESQAFGVSGVGPVRLGIPGEAAQRGPAPRPGLPRQWRLPARPGPSQEPATARGYTDGYQRGLADARDRNRYDPVRHGSYRSGDAGYSRNYGPRTAYRNNYRSGFRQGYEDGYRDGARGRR